MTSFEKDPYDLVDYLGPDIKTLYRLLSTTGVFKFSIELGVRWLDGGGGGDLRYNIACL